MVTMEEFGALLKIYEGSMGVYGFYGGTMGFFGVLWGLWGNLRLYRGSMSGLWECMGFNYSILRIQRF